MQRYRIFSLKAASRSPTIISELRDSRQAHNIFQEVLMASALALSDASGVFNVSEVSNTLDLMAPGKGEYQVRIKQYLTQFASDRRGKILTRSGIKSDYRYRFSDALMQPFIIMKGMQNTMIDESLRRLLFHSGCRPACHDGSRRSRSGQDHREPG